MTVRTQTWALGGGLDLESPAMSIPAGKAILAQNYESSVAGGYRRMDGYTLYDGSATPSTLIGSGAVLGVWEFGGDVFAFRNNVGNTACVMYKASTSGWEVVSTPTLLPSGRFEFVNHNFTGASSGSKMYGVDGKNKAFEFDGTTFTQLTTGMVEDSPTHIGVHKNHLFVSYRGGSVQHSGIGDPTSWTLASGAGELGIGSEVTGIKSQRGNALVISATDRITILYGTSAANWDLKTFASDLGVKPFTDVQLDSDLFFVTDSGVSSLQATQAFGDFAVANLSTPVSRFVKTRIPTLVGASVHKDKSQMRVFFSDGTVLVGTIAQKEIVGWTTWLVPCVPSCLSGERYMGCDDGSVYLLDTGTTFNGESIESFLRLAFNNVGTSSRKKRFRRAFLELDAGNTANLQFIADYDFGSGAASNVNTAQVYGGGGFWDIEYWENFVWSAATVATAEAQLNGTGNNISMLIYHNTAEDQPFTLQGVRLNFTLRGQIR